MNSTSIYLVLDMENDLIHEDGPNGKAPFGQQAKERGVIAKTREASAAFTPRASRPMAWCRVSCAMATIVTTRSCSSRTAAARCRRASTRARSRG